MKNILRFGIISFAFAAGVILVAPDSANAQNRRHANREYRDDIRDAREDYNRRVRQGNYTKARREYREDIRDARREYVQNVRRDRNGWYWYQNNRRYYRPFSMWNYRNGYFYRRY
ncbi:MAG: hypothetical protein HOP17_10740 [Acidobacteria bacterium]|nr:hypothetical protein [Acidobacteriota bacterium]